MNIELSFLDWIQTQLRCEFLDAAMPLITHLGDGGILWILSSLVFLVIPQKRKTGAAIAAGLILEVLCCNIVLKPLTARIRPFTLNPAVDLLIPRPTDYSFPSGHSGASFAFASALYFGKNKLWPPALILAFLIAFSRLYLYVHYPTDVLAGMLIGIMSGWAGNAAVNVIAKHLPPAGLKKIAREKKSKSDF